MENQELVENRRDLYKNNKPNVPSPSQFDKQSKIGSITSSKRIQEVDKEHEKDISDDNTVLNVKVVPIVSVQDGEETPKVVSKSGSKVASKPGSKVASKPESKV